MEFCFNLLHKFESIVSDASKSVECIDGSFDPQIRIADERFGDFQANGVLPFAKRNGINPRELAQSVINKIPPDDSWSVSLAGPGFINFKLSTDYLIDWLEEIGLTSELKIHLQKSQLKYLIYSQLGN